MKFNYINLFAGAGGLYEGFKQYNLKGDHEFDCLGLFEEDKASCFTLMTRGAYWASRAEDETLELYRKYAVGKYSSSPSVMRETFYHHTLKDQQLPVRNIEFGPKTLENIVEITERSLDGRSLDLLAGGPVCQSFSNSSKYSRANIYGWEPKLYPYYFDYITRFQPKLFFFESVVGIVSAKGPAGVPYTRVVDDLAEKAGYQVSWILMDANDYGVPQHRRRVLALGTKQGIRDRDFYFMRMLSKTASRRGAVAGDVFDRMPDPSSEHNFLQHKTWSPNKRTKEIYRMCAEFRLANDRGLLYKELPAKYRSHKNSNGFADRYRVVAPDLPSYTIVSHLSRDGNNFIHPDPEQARAITVREAAGLQSFPDDYCFESVGGGFSLGSAFKQIGESMAPLVVEKLAGLIGGWLAGEEGEADDAFELGS